MIYNIAKNNKIFGNEIKKWHENFNWEIAFSPNSIVF